MKNTILLIAGIALTLAFILAASPAYEALYYERAFSNEMYNNSLYLVVALITAAVAWAAAGTFYYLINSVRFSRWYHWLIVLAVACVAAPVIVYAYADGVFSDLGLNFSAQLGGFCGVEVLVEALLFIVASFAIRWWSSNCRHTPIPE